MTSADPSTWKITPYPEPEDWLSNEKNECSDCQWFYEDSDGDELEEAECISCDLHTLKNDPVWISGPSYVEVDEGLYWRRQDAQFILDAIAFYFANKNLLKGA